MQKRFVIKFEPIFTDDSEIVFRDFETDHEESLIGAHRCMVDFLDELIEEGFEPIFYTLQECCTRQDFETGHCMIDFKNYRWSWFFVESDNPDWTSNINEKI